MSNYRFYYYFSFSFADAISPEIASRIVGSSVDAVNGFQPVAKSSVPMYNRMRSIWNTRVAERYRRTRVLGLGSIFHHANSRDKVWGSGVNPFWQDKVKQLTCKSVLALRGPLSRKYLMDRYDFEAPEVYGDPALLMPKLFPELKREEPVRKLLILAQHHDEKNIMDFVGKDYSASVLLCQKNNPMEWREVVREILRSEFVVSTSLHGLIIADAFGVPSRWLHHESLPSVKTEGRFKYNDYYAATGRGEDLYATSVAQALSIGPVGSIQGYDATPLLEAFPQDRFTAKLNPAISKR
jgi:pyruvyltransferase